MLRDNYIALGMHRDASAEEILDAYRKLARTYHPDLNPSDPEAEKRFEEVQAAFEVLSDPERRAAYDRTEQSFATVRRSASRLRDAGDDTQSVVRAFAAVRRQSRRRPSLLVWQGSVYVPAMIDVTIAWLIVMLVGILLLVIARSSCTGIEPLSSEEIKSAHEQASAFMFFGKSLCVGATLVYGIVMLVLLREHSSQ